MSNDRDPCPEAAARVRCEECVEFLLDYVDGRLPAEQRFQFESHVAFCPACEDYVENYKQAAELCRDGGERLRSEQERPLPQELVDAILKARKAGGGGGSARG
ncbi:MAG: anti-sigma factor family protein [Planctomycetota bacterium]|jgi:anti-sigma factor RsiW